VFENRVDKFAFNWGKYIKKCFHHTVEMANDAQFDISSFIKVTPAPGKLSVVDFDLLDLEERGRRSLVT
jgi:hypothetical protein